MTDSCFKVRYRKKLIPKRRLMTATIELTRRCNLNCIHCHNRLSVHECGRKVLSTKQVCDILGQMRKAGVMSLIFTGGEPLLRRDFKEIYRFAKKNNFAVNVNTNATLLTKDMVRFLKNNPPMSLNISCYGVTPGTYESVTRVPGSFSKFQGALSLLKGSGVRVIFKFITMKNNFREAARAEVLAQRMGMRYGCFYLLGLRVDRDQSKNALIKRQRLNVTETVELFEGMGEDLRKFFFSFPGCGPVEGCGAASLACTVDPQGWLTPCTYLSAPRVSLITTRFDKAWDLLALRESPVKKKQAACKNCRHTTYCRWCPGASYVETGSTEERIPYYCDLMEGLSRVNAIGSR